MPRILTSKFVVVSLLSAMLLVPMHMIRGLVHEREAYRDQVLADVAGSSTSAQTIIAPVLVLPCTQLTTARVEQDGVQRVTEVPGGADCTRVIRPKTLSITGQMAPEVRRRGIYQALVYVAQLKLQGHIALSPTDEREDAAVRDYGTPYLAIGVADTRGIAHVPNLQINGRRHDFQAGAGLAALGAGVHVEVDSIDPRLPGEMEYTVDLRLNGMEKLRIVPAGAQTEVDLKSEWPHPSFIGRYLPESRRVDADGFSAHWISSDFSTDMEQLFSKHMHDPMLGAQLVDNSFGVALIEPVDVYLQSERAIKYGFLFVSLTFIALILAEILRRLKIHPVQYSMVGAALAMFFLLLLSMAEHIGFAMAYLLASAACVGLIGYYVGSVVRSSSVGTGFVVLLSSLYAVLYLLLTSEDHALLLGAVFVFAILAVAMVLTRKVDWYELSVATKSTPA